MYGTVVAGYFLPLELRPVAGMGATGLWAVIYNEANFVSQVIRGGKNVVQFWILAVLNGLTFLLAVWMTAESGRVLLTARADEPLPEEAAV